MSNPHKFQNVIRVVRVPCPSDCESVDCPGHVPAGSTGIILPYAPERMIWGYRGQTLKQYAWRIQWDNGGGWWTMEHCIESEDSMSPGFPDAVWTEG